MAAQPDQLIGAAPGMTPEELTAIGFFPGEFPEAPIGYVDPLPDATGEHARGCLLRRHPDFDVRDDPDLWSVVERFKAGIDRDLGHDHYERWSAWMIDAWSILRAAESRERVREMTRAREGAADGH